MLRTPGVKIYSDVGTCLRPAVSYDLPEETIRDGQLGDLFLTEEELTEDVAQMQAAGYQAVIHATGDRAVETVQDTLEAICDN